MQIHLLIFKTGASMFKSHRATPRETTKWRPTTYHTFAPAKSFALPQQLLFSSHLAIDPKDIQRHCIDVFSIYDPRRNFANSINRFIPSFSSQKTWASPPSPAKNPSNHHPFKISSKRTILSHRFFRSPPAVQYLVLPFQKKPPRNHSPTPPSTHFVPPKRLQPCLQLAS